MDRTKNGVSANKVKLDLRAARSTASLAVSRLVREINTELREFRTLDESSLNLAISAAKHIRSAAEHLVTATETRKALEYAEEREYLEIVNRKKVTLYRTPQGQPVCPNCGADLRIDVSEHYNRAAFNIDEDGSFDYHLADEHVVESIVERIWCSRHGALCLLIDDVESRDITWKTIDYETVKEIDRDRE